ncbi:hypothetical protein KM043_017747 [Ampulex compressa]|nr:hypothetical protein KM043_017747 [Ampulex compressa]
MDKRIPPVVSSPEMFDSDVENEANENVDKVLEHEDTSVAVSPEKLSTADLIIKSDNYLLARVNKFLSGVPPPPKHTICRIDCSEFLMRIRENQQYFWTACPLPESNVQWNAVQQSLEQQPLKNSNENNSYRRTKNLSRNLNNAFDACDVHFKNANVDNVNDKNTNVCTIGESMIELNANSHATNMLDNTKNVINSSMISVGTDKNVNDNKRTQMSSNILHEESHTCYTTNEKEITSLTWPEAYHHKFHGIHYNRNKVIEDFENLTSKLCERYIGAETQSTCTVWFSKQAPGSARKRSLLAKRENGQSPGKRLSHLARRRRTFSSANLQGLGLNDKKQLMLNIKKPISRKGKSPRGKSPRGKSPRSSTKKKVVRRLALGGLSPLKSKLETSKRALFQSPPSDRAGPSKLFATSHTNPQRIKRALFPTPRKKEDADTFKKTTIEETLAWDQERHSSSNILPKSETTFAQGRNELSDTHRKKLLWAVAEALRSKGIGMGHPQFKQYASNLARTIKKFMPDLENRNIPRKPGSTSDRMLKLAKHHVLFIIDARPTD